MADTSLPTGSQIYDAIMAEVEPELVSASLSLLEEKYRDEPEVQRLVRMERYGKAFTEYDKRYQAYQDSVSTSIKRCKLTARQAAEHRSQRQEEGVQQAILSQMNSL